MDGEIPEFPEQSNTPEFAEHNNISGVNGIHDFMLQHNQEPSYMEDQPVVQYINGIDNYTTSASNCYVYNQQRTGVCENETIM